MRPKKFLSLAYEWRAFLVVAVQDRCLLLGAFGLLLKVGPQW